MMLPGLGSRGTVRERWGAARGLVPWLAGLCDRKRAVLLPFGQRVPVEKLHDEVLVTLVLADVEQGTDVRVFEARDVARLALEALAQKGIRGQARREHFDGDGPIETGIAGLEDLPHAPFADEGDNLIRA